MGESLRIMVHVFPPEIENTKNEEEDVTFVVEDQEIKASSKKLSAVSSVFNTMFESDYKEAHDKRVIIEDATVDDFTAFIKALDGKDKPSGKNIEALHKLCDKYDTQDLLQRCREFLWKTDEVKLFNKFCLAEQWEDEKLLKQLTGDIHSVSCLKQLEQEGMATKLQPTTVDLILNKGFSFI
ncbi:BTB/POZ domain-containing protein [Aphelenchoides avenae]|nr:BTB/POZ domain-containing protein [Aphelenchus avenae]